LLLKIVKTKKLAEKLKKYYTISRKINIFAELLILLAF